MDFIKTCKGCFNQALKLSLLHFFKHFLVALVIPVKCFIHNIPVHPPTKRISEGGLELYEVLGMGWDCYSNKKIHEERN